jgi:GntR family transcriptional regulator, trigonelline degradation regulator
MQHQRSSALPPGLARGYQMPRGEPSLTDRVTAQLRDAILQLRLAPGQRLVERDLAENTGASRTCVRAALQRLGSEGLVARSPSGMLSVASISPDEARQIYEVRAALESAMARQFVARATEADQQALADAAAQVERAVRHSDPEAYVAAFGAFYAVLLRGSGNEIAHRFLNMLHARITYLRRLTTDRASITRETQTAKLLRGVQQAAAARDADLAATRSEAFVARSARFALQVLADAAITQPPAPAPDRDAPVPGSPLRPAVARSRASRHATTRASRT